MLFLHRVKALLNHHFTVLILYTILLCHDATGAQAKRLHGSTALLFDADSDCGAVWVGLILGYNNNIAGLVD